MSGVPDTLAALSLAVLAIGAGLGLVSRLILPRRSSMSLAGTILAGILGSVVGAVIAQVVTGNPGDPRIGAVLLFSVIGTVTVLLLAERFVGRSTPTALELIHAGESFHVEFKSTARHNLRSGQRDDRIEAAIAKTVVGFLNASGGTLLIGVDDKGSVLGLDDDLAHLKEPTLDRYALRLHDYLTRVLGGSRRCPGQPGSPSRHSREGWCAASMHRDHPARSSCARTKGAEIQFYARFGNSTRTLGVADAIDYPVDHFHRRHWRPSSRR